MACTVSPTCHEVSGLSGSASGKKKDSITCTDQTAPLALRNLALAIVDRQKELIKYKGFQGKHINFHSPCSVGVVIASLHTSGMATVAPSVFIGSGGDALKIR